MSPVQLKCHLWEIWIFQKTVSSIIYLLIGVNRNAIECVFMEVPMFMLPWTSPAVCELNLYDGIKRWEGKYYWLCQNIINVWSTWISFSCIWYQFLVQRIWETLMFSLVIGQPSMCVTWNEFKSWVILKIQMPIYVHRDPRDKGLAFCVSNVQPMNDSMKSLKY